MIRYLVTTSVYLSVFYILYFLLIRNDTRYRRNRFYLLCSMFVSLLLPLINVETGSAGVLSSITGKIDTVIGLDDINIYPDTKESLGRNMILLPQIIYYTGCIVAAVILMINIFNLLVAIKRYGIKGTNMVLMPPGRESGFSAMGYIFLSSSLGDDVRKTIREHELRHIRNRHFIDIAILRFLGIFFWFNPFIYMYDRSLKALHEFETDEQMLDAGRNVVSYQRLILNQIFNTGIFTLQNGFSGRSLIKKRMIMMTKKRSKKSSALKLLLVLPVVLFVFSLFSCSNDDLNPLEGIYEPDTHPAITDKQGINTNTKVPVEISENNSMLKSGADTEEKEIFVVVETMPTFRGGDVLVFREWVQSRIKYPVEAAREGIQGKVFVMFVVNEDGYISDIEIMRGVDPRLDDEVKRVVASSPVWSPGIQRDIPVSVRFSIAVNFQLQ